MCVTMFAEEGTLYARTFLRVILCNRYKLASFVALIHLSVNLRWNATARFASVKPAHSLSVCSLVRYSKCYLSSCLESFFLFIGFAFFAWASLDLLPTFCRQIWCTTLYGTCSIFEILAYVQYAGYSLWGWQVWYLSKSTACSISARHLTISQVCLM